MTEFAPVVIVAAIAVAITIIVAVLAIRAAWSAGKAAGMVAVKAPLREALAPYGLHLSYVTETVRPIDAVALAAAGLACPADARAGIDALRDRLRADGLDLLVVRAPAAGG
jgi:hypothetical protein